MNKFKEYQDYINHLNESSEIEVSKDIFVVGPKEKEAELIKLTKEYDWFTSMIDSLPQQKEAEADNKMILSKLKLLGASKILHKNFSIPMVGKKTKEIDIK